MAKRERFVTWDYFLDIFNIDHFEPPSIDDLLGHYRKVRPRFEWKSEPITGGWRIFSRLKGPK